MSKNYKYEIKFNNINDVPELYADGKKIKIINSIDFHWYTATDTKYGDASFSYRFLKHVKDINQMEINQFSTSTPEGFHKFDLNNGNQFANNRILQVGD